MCTTSTAVQYACLVCDTGVVRHLRRHKRQHAWVSRLWEHKRRDRIWCFRDCIWPCRAGRPADCGTTISRLFCARLTGVVLHHSLRIRTGCIKSRCTHHSDPSYSRHGAHVRSPTLTWAISMGTIGAQQQESHMHINTFRLRILKVGATIFKHARYITFEFSTFASEDWARFRKHLTRLRWHSLAAV